MKYRVTVLTPTIVGDGNRLSPIDYMVWRDQVNVLDQNRIFKLLSKGPRLEGYLAQLQRVTKLDFASWGGFAQNYADRRVSFEDPSCTPCWEKAPVESLSIPTFAATRSGPFLPGAAVKGALRNGYVFAHMKPEALKSLAGDRLPRHPSEAMERQAVGSGGSDRMRVISVADSGPLARDPFRVYMLRVATLVAKAPGQYTLGWKQAGRGSVEGKRPEDATPTFAEMASPGTQFEGLWRENAFLNVPEVRQSLRWNQPVTRDSIFSAANLYAEKQLELHGHYAERTGLVSLAASVAELRHKLEAARNAGSCLLSIGWGGGFLSKSSAIGAPEEDQRAVLGGLPYYERAIKSGMPFPKTRRIVFVKNKPATLPGWVELGVSE